MSFAEKARTECERRDAEGIPVDPSIAILFGVTTWTEWERMMTKPHPLLMAMKFVEAPAGTYTYKPKPEGK